MAINTAITQLVQDRIIKVYPGYKEELSQFATDINSKNSYGDTVNVLVSTPGTATNLTSLSGAGSANIVPASVVINQKLGEIIALKDEDVYNLGSNIGDVVQQSIDNAIATTIANAHALVTAANFTLVTGVTAKAYSAVTFADFNANINAVQKMTGNRPNLQKLTFVCKPDLFNLIIDGINTGNATFGRQDLSDAIGLGTSFNYKGVKIVRSLNLPASLNGGYFTDGTGLATVFGSDKASDPTVNIDTVVDADSGLPVTIRSFYDQYLMGTKFVPYIISGTAKANVNGIVIPSWT